MNRIEIAGKIYSAPSCWNDLDQKTLISWASICLKKIPLSWAFKLAIISVYVIPKRIFNQMNEGHFLQIRETLKFLYEKNNLNRWVIPHFYVGFTKYYGPADALANLTIAEYRKTELLYQMYVRTGKTDQITQLIATLYRPKRKGVIHDDIREELNEGSVKKRYAEFERLSPAFRHAILLNYEGCRNFIFQKFQPAFISNGPETNELNDLEVIIEAVAGEKFGNFVETEKTNLFRFFRHLVVQIERADEMKTES